MRLQIIIFMAHLVHDLALNFTIWRTQRLVDTGRTLVGSIPGCCRKTSWKEPKAARMKKGPCTYYNFLLTVQFQRDCIQLHLKWEGEKDEGTLWTYTGSSVASTGFQAEKIRHEEQTFTWIEVYTLILYFFVNVEGKYMSAVWHSATLNGPCVWCIVREGNIIVRQMAEKRSLSDTDIARETLLTLAGNILVGIGDDDEVSQVHDKLLIVW